MIKIKQNDYGVGRRATLTDSNGPVDLTDATVTFKFNGYEISPEIEDAENGKVLVVFQEIHTADTGTFNGEFKVRFDGSRETIPVDKYVTVLILAEGGN